MRNIIITGAGGDLAQAIVKQLPDARLILIGREAALLENLYVFHPHKACFQLDICDEHAVAACLHEVEQRYGAIDVLINNAGYAVYDDFDCLTTEEARKMFEVNVFAGMTFCQLVGHNMKALGRGHIVNIVSMSGFLASAKSSLYSASKFAMIGYSDAIRLELADKGVFVTTVNPGPIATKFFKQADPEGTYLKSIKPFLIPVDLVAQKIVMALGKNVREINLPRTLAFARKFYVLFPKTADFLARTLFNYK
ncbi:SDR family NAD(P)-dependent oxidoreductase [Aggregatibacter actinomycetemcomitans]|uniref:SDR family NAD(P)-dependent oxidoreductase n=1 Tax=Aggregatibacter actinomycetemcomitans TaxID=714 RepID=UPI001E3F4446|nr:SDR family NAD(P)-dependent oxidoreductase [Aggregatibacter actinomycetemcomitans]